MPFACRQILYVIAQQEYGSIQPLLILSRILFHAWDVPSFTLLSLCLSLCSLFMILIFCLFQEIPLYNSSRSGWRFVFKASRTRTYQVRGGVRLAAAPVQNKPFRSWRHLEHCPKPLSLSRVPTTLPFCSLQRLRELKTSLFPLLMQSHLMGNGVSQRTHYTESRNPTIKEQMYRVKFQFFVFWRPINRSRDATQTFL